MKTKYTQDEIVELLSKHGLSPLSPIGTLQSNIAVTHPMYGEVTSRLDRLIKNGHPKANVAETLKRKQQNTAAKIAKIAQDLGLELLSEYSHPRVKIKLRDPVYGEWETYPGNFLTSKRHPKAAHISVGRQKAMSEQQLKDKLHALYGDEVMLVSGYVKHNVKALFRDKEFGEWEATPNNVLKGRRHPDRGERNRTRSMSTDFSLFHWKTGEQLSCRASYEAKVVEWLNAHQIDYEWQPKKFSTPFLTDKTNKTAYYWPDLYIPFWLETQGPLWVEIKGWIDRNPLGRKKWEWFKSEHKNSQLWDFNRLKELGILHESKKRNKS